MPSIEILGTGWVDRRDSAFPQSIQLPSGEILCSFPVGGGANVTGGTEWARSTAGGRTWSLEGKVLEPSRDPVRSNALKFTLSPDGATIYAYGSRSYKEPNVRFGEVSNEAVLCRSTDGGRSWSEPQIVPMPQDCSLEISHGALVLDSGRLLAPAATLPAPDRLGEEVVVAISDDAGQTWPRSSVVFRDPDKKHGYFEQKLAQIAPNRVMAVAWTVTLGEVEDRPNSFALSSDGGLTWSPAQSTGITGQTMTPIPLGGDRLLVLYNRRYGEQGIVMCLVRFTETSWEVLYEGLMYDAKAERERPQDADGVEELYTFTFGFPTAIGLQDGTFLATHWCFEEGSFGIRWTKLRVHGET